MFFDLSLLYGALLLLQFTIYSLLSLLSAVWGTTAFTIYNLQSSYRSSFAVCGISPVRFSLLRHRAAAARCSLCVANRSIF